MLVVDLWTWRTDSIPDGGLLSVLSPDEVARANRYRYARDRNGFIQSRGRMRQILAGHLGRRADELVFQYGEHGKPVLFGPGAPSFNLSDSGDLACLALAPAHSRVGIDIEQKKPRDYLKLAERYFSPAELGMLRAQPAESHAEHFFRGWTRKEAFLKAAGTGLATRLDAFDVTVCDHAPPRLTRIDPQHFPDLDPDPGNWRLFSFEPADGYAGALAVHTAGEELKVVLRS